MRVDLDSLRAQLTDAERSALPRLTSREYDGSLERAWNHVMIAVGRMRPGANADQTAESIERRVIERLLAQRQTGDGAEAIGTGSF